MRHARSAGPRPTVWQEAAGDNGGPPRAGQDPDAGIYHVVIGQGQARSAAGFLFHEDAVTGRADAALDAQAYRSPGVSVVGRADALSESLAATGMEFTRSTLELPIGTAIQVNLNRLDTSTTIHIRAIYLPAGDAVVEISLSTLGPPSDSMATAFLDIVRSARLVPGSAASP